MKRRLIKTNDGSLTFFVPELGEHYHSIHGALRESEHIYVKAAFDHCPQKSLRVLEFGMGTGLNLLLTYQKAKKSKREVHYHAIEKYPLSKEEANLLKSGPSSLISDPFFTEIHTCPWEIKIAISKSFSLFKEQNDFRTAEPEGLFDVIYFDAFSPEVQPMLWTAEIFQKIYNLAAPGAILTTYSAKGQVKRNLVTAGFSIEKLPGPPGKREFLRAVKP